MTTPETTKQVTKEEKVTKALLISVLSPLIFWSPLIFLGLGVVGSGLLGYMGADEYERDTGKKANKLGYTLVSAIGLGFINPYTFDVFRE